MGEQTEKKVGPWGPDSTNVRVAVRGLTRTEKRIVAAGYIGDARMNTVRNLQRKGMFYHHITSPNGRCGPMELTPLGINARAIIKAALTTGAPDA